jgi:hypothetical protein
VVRVEGHWRSTGWVRAHIRHPHRPGSDQVVLFSLGWPVRLDARDWWPDGMAPQSRLADRPRTAGVELPSPREPRDSAE